MVRPWLHHSERHIMSLQLFKWGWLDMLLVKLLVCLWPGLKGIENTLENTLENIVEVGASNPPTTTLAQAGQTTA